MKNALVSPVARNLLFDRLEIRQQVSVRQDHAPRLRRRPRRKYDFNRIAALRPPTGKKAVAARFPAASKKSSMPDRTDAASCQREAAANHRKPHARLFGDSPANSLSAVKSIGTATAPRKMHPRNARDPFARVLAPQQHPLALLDSSRFKLPSELHRRTQQVRVRPPHRAIPAPPNDGCFARRTRVGAEIFEQGLRAAWLPEFRSSAYRLGIALGSVGPATRDRCRVSPGEFRRVVKAKTRRENNSRRACRNRIA